MDLVLVALKVASALFLVEGALAEMVLVVVVVQRPSPAWFLVELGLLMDPVWLLKSYLGVEGLELDVVALSLVEWDLDLAPDQALCPGFGLIYA